MSDLHELLERPHYGIGTGCQCCKLVDDGHLARLLAIEEAARAIAKRPCRIFDYSSCIEAGVEPECDPCIARAALL